MKDYASELAERWSDWVNYDDKTVHGAIEGAIREALAKAAEVAEEHEVARSDAISAIRALGAKP